MACRDLERLMLIEYFEYMKTNIDRFTHEFDLRVDVNKQTAKVAEELIEFYAELVRGSTEHIAKEFADVLYALTLVASEYLTPEQMANGVQYIIEKNAAKNKSTHEVIDGTIRKVTH